jgi:hypothetical protein
MFSQKISNFLCRDAWASFTFIHSQQPDMFPENLLYFICRIAYSTEYQLYIEN